MTIKSPFMPKRGGDTGYVGCNNSWMIGNSPKMGERAGTTGNQNI